MITTLFGGPCRAHEAWAAALPKPFRVGTDQDFLAGPHDLQMLAVFLLRMAKVPGAEGNRTTMPIWDLRLDGQLTGRPLTSGEVGELSPKVGQAAKQIAAQPPLVMVIDVVEWWNALASKSIDPAGDPVVSRALREQRAVETLYWLARSIPVVLVTWERPRMLCGEVVGYEPDLPGCLTAACDLIIDVRAKTQTIYSAKASVIADGRPFAPGAPISQATFYSTLGLLSEPALDDPNRDDDEEMPA